jgi:hypothetical protein
MKEKKLLKIQSLPKVLREQAKLANAKELLIERPLHNRTMSHVCTEFAFF